MTSARFRRRGATSPHIGLALTGLAVVGVLTGPSGQEHFSPVIPAVLFAVLGGLILRRRPGHAIGRLYLALGVWLAWFAFLNGRDPGQAADVLEQLVLWLVSWAWAVGLLLPVTLGILLLPDGQLPSRRWRWVVRALVAGCGALILALPYDSGAPAGLRMAAPPKLVVDVVLGAGFLLVLIALLASVVSPFVRYRQASATDRSALRLIGLLALVSVVSYVGGTSVPSLPGDVVATVALAVLPIGVTVAIVRHGMMDIDRLVSRAVSYLIVTLILAAVYLSIAMVPTVLLGAADVPDLVVACTTLVVAALFRPVGGRVKRSVDRRFNRSRYDAVRTVEAFGARLRDDVDLGSLTSDLRDVVAATVQPRLASVWLRSAEG